MTFLGEFFSLQWLQSEKKNSLKFMLLNPVVIGWFPVFVILLYQH